MKQVAKSLGVLVVLAALYVLVRSCGLADTHPPNADTHPLNQEVNAPFTIRPVGMETLSFIKLADELVARKAPRWYDPDTQIHLDFGLIKNFASMRVTDKGTLDIVLERHALVLATVEDLAAVLLHEYVHVDSWDYVYNVGKLTSFESEGHKEKCLRALTEMLSNKVVVEMYHVIRYGHVLLQHQTDLYQEQYVYAHDNCPTVVTLGMPKVIHPVGTDAE